MKKIVSFIILSTLVAINLIGKVDGICQDNCWCKCFNSPSSDLQPYYSQFKYLVHQAISRKNELGSGGTFFNMDLTFTGPTEEAVLRPLQTNIFSMLALTLPVDNNFNPFSLAFNGRFSFGSFFQFWSPSWNCKSNCVAVQMLETIETWSLWPQMYNTLPHWISSLNYWNNGGFCMKNKNIFLNRRMDILIGNNNVIPKPPNPWQVHQDISISVGNGSPNYQTFAYSPFYFFDFTDINNDILKKVSENIVKCMKESCCCQGKKSCKLLKKPSKKIKKAKLVGNTEYLMEKGANFTMSTNSFTKFMKKLVDQKNDERYFDKELIQILKEYGQQ